MSLSVLSHLKSFIVQNNLSYSYYTLAQFICDSVEGVSEFCLWLCVLAQHEVEQGHVCISIDTIAEKSTALGWVRIPHKQQLTETIKSSPVIGVAGDSTPLILDQDKLYLNRLYHNEKSISDFLLARTQHEEAYCREMKQIIDDQFAPTASVDFQKLALIISLRHPISIISGGPGTGKTWVVGKILQALIQLQSHQSHALKITMAAPTGKAAARLSASIHALISNITLKEKQKQLISQQAVTLHRLMGIHRYTHRARFNQNNPLDCDVLVVDEASMIDQQMMSMLCKALPAHCKLILLGDKDQLSSVEAGSVFADLCGGLKRTSFRAKQSDWLHQEFAIELEYAGSDFVLADHVVVLEKSRRFNDQSRIGQLAKSINHGDIEKSFSILRQSSPDSGLSIRNVQPAEIMQQISQQKNLSYSAMMQADSISEAFALFHQYQVLCALWSGPQGVDQLNQQIEQWLKYQSGINQEETYYKGLPVIMSANLYQFEVYNGDIGILWPDEQGQLRVWFEASNNDYRSLSLSQCPPHKTAYAMTVHKAQGSEYHHVLTILPNSITPLSTRELLYTAITRAIDSVEIWASDDIVEATIEQKTQRESGLMQRLHD